jgi:hypothetical protein
MAEEDAVAELTRLRQGRARAFLFARPRRRSTRRASGSAWPVHNLLALGHPGLDGRGLDRRQERIVDASLPVAELGPPESAEEAVRRHSLLARLGEITRTEHTVEYWAGRRRYVGRQPPPHLLALPRVRRVTTTSVRRPLVQGDRRPRTAGGRSGSRSPREPRSARRSIRCGSSRRLAWERILPVLALSGSRARGWPPARDGLESVGTAPWAALLRFASLRESAAPRPPARPSPSASWRTSSGCSTSTGPRSSPRLRALRALLTAADSTCASSSRPTRPAGARGRRAARAPVPPARCRRDPADRQGRHGAVCRFAVQGPP